MNNWSSYTVLWKKSLNGIVLYGSPRDLLLDWSNMLLKKVKVIAKEKMMQTSKESGIVNLNHNTHMLCLKTFYFFLIIKMKRTLNVMSRMYCPI